MANVQGLSPQPVQYLRKGVNCSGVCVLCENGLENNWHCFLTCDYSKECWVQAQFWNSMEPLLLQMESSEDFIFRFLPSLNGDRRGLFSMILLSIWRRRRNVLLWDNIHEEASGVLARASQVLHEWSLARVRPEEQQAHSSAFSAWSKALSLLWLGLNH